MVKVSKDDLLNFGSVELRNCGAFALLRFPAYALRIFLPLSPYLLPRSGVTGKGCQPLRLEYSFISKSVDDPCGEAFDIILYALGRYRSAAACRRAFHIGEPVS